jgi:hypothetical protein
MILVYISTGNREQLAAFLFQRHYLFRYYNMRLIDPLECRSKFIFNTRKDFDMFSDRQRILELALESLQSRKKQLDAEISEITRELRGGSGKSAGKSSKSAATAPAKTRSRFSREERLRRSKRMTAYWKNWRKQKASQK